MKEETIQVYLQKFVIMRVNCVIKQLQSNSLNSLNSLNQSQPVPMQEDVSESPHNFVVESQPTIELAIDFVPATSESTSDQTVLEVPVEQDGILDDGGNNEEEEPTQITIPLKVFRCKTCLGRFSCLYNVWGNLQLQEQSITEDTHKRET